MSTPTILVATWSDGLFVVRGEGREHELAGQSVRGLSRDRQGGVLAIVGGHSLRRRSPAGEWTTVASHEADLSCCMVVGGAVIVGTDDARLLRVDLGGEIELLAGFDEAEGRENWYAGQAVINGQVLGPPLGVRSLARTSDGSALLANVHVGGIPRSTDGGRSWQPTIDVDSDVHEVCAHPSDPALVVSATAIGLGISRDGGATWSIEQEGLHAPYCSAVRFAGDDILVAAAADHFAAEGAIYRRAIAGGRLEPLAGPPRWIEGIADTGCIATEGPTLAVADKAGNLYVSEDAGGSWSRWADGLPGPGHLLIV